MVIKLFQNVLCGQNGKTVSEIKEKFNTSDVKNTAST